MSTVRSMIRATLACAVLVTLISGAVLWTQGYRVYVIHTGSMDPTYRPGDVVIDRPAQRRYHAGEVITFLHSSQTTDVVTHRITDITPTGLIHTKGDANRTADVWDIRPGQVRGSVAMSFTGLGYFLVFLHQPAGAASLGLSTLALVLLWTLFFPPRASDGESRRPAHVRTVAAPYAA
jgi:signal peptidase I